RGGYLLRKSGGDPEWNRRRLLRCRWLASGTGAVAGVVAAEDGASALCDREVRACNGHNRINDRPLGAPASPTSNRLCRGSWVGGRRRCTQIADGAAA